MTYSRTSADEVCQAFAHGATVDLAGADVPAALLVELLTGAPLRAEGRIPALRLAGAVVRGPLELPGATVPALVELTGCTFDAPIDLYAAELAGWRLVHCTLPGLRAANLRVRSELALQMCTVTGPVVLPDARIEGPLRLIGTRLDTAGGRALRRPAAGRRVAVPARGGGRHHPPAPRSHRLDEPRCRPDGSIKPSLDARAATIGKDIYASRGFTATGGVRLSLAEVSKSVSFDDARLGGPGAGVSALRARGMTCQELRLRFAEPPRGDVNLAGAAAGSVLDGAQLWDTDGVVDVEDFRYQSLTASPDVYVATRLRWLQAVLPGYDPGLRVIWYEIRR